MEVFIALAVIGLICWVAYKSGKQFGSRKGYGIGRARSRAKL